MYLFKNEKLIDTLHELARNDNFPGKLKDAYVTPVLKNAKEGSHSIITLSNFSKIF